MDPRAGRARGWCARKFFAGTLDDLTAFASHQRKLAQPQKDGRTTREHLEAAAKAGSPVAKAELKGPALPLASAYVWTWFLELHEARCGTLHEKLGWVPHPLAYAEIAAWAQLTGRRLEPWEITWLRALDRLWIAGPQKEAPA